MRILLESPNCNAFAGSNGAVGYGWMMRIAERHEVHLVTYGPAYDAGHPAGVAPAVDNVYPIKIGPTRARRLGGLSDYALTAARKHREIVRQVRPDVVHAVEPGGWLGPRVFVRGDVPSVLGPLNGGAALPSRSFMNAVLRDLPVSPARDLVRGGARKLAVTLFNEALFGNIPSARALARSAMRKARRILIATSLTPGAVPSRLADRVRRMPLVGIDPNVFAPRPRPPSAGPRLLYAGRIVPAKGLHLAIEAVRGTDAHLRIAGPVPPDDDWYAAHCRRRAEDLGIADRVVWLGALAREELAREYAAADVFVTLSLWEPFGMTYLEAMACGTPVVALAAGGVTELVAPGTGWLVEPTSPEGVVGAVRSLVRTFEEDRAEVRARGEAARSHVLRTYAWDRMMDELDRIYAEIRR